jgi:hypothetical protein
LRFDPSGKYFACQAADNSIDIFAVHAEDQVNKKRKKRKNKEKKKREKNPVQEIPASLEIGTSLIYN